MPDLPGHHVMSRQKRSKVYLIVYFIGLGICSLGALHFHVGISVMIVGLGVALTALVDDAVDQIVDHLKSKD